MKIDISGLRDGEPWPGYGETLDVPQDEGQALCRKGFAEAVGLTLEAAREVRIVEPEPGVMTTRRGPGRPRKSAA
ncbi:hypothetical protein [Parafrankia sp. EUN1f]|uniref:hypothetical protein n=1 Tax=Parafrankia sp. EUN1f TaxID=102897 RepID=UPI0012FA0269|nr:hypothetical protein [Parafrankia sp. EUN1f]